MPCQGLHDWVKDPDDDYDHCAQCGLVDRDYIDIDQIFYDANEER